MNYAKTMCNNLPPRVWLEVDLAALKNNFQKLSAAAAPARVMAVIKADAYGMGGLPVARVLSAAGAARLAVAVPDEAFALAPLGLPVQILGAVLPNEIPELVRAGIVLPLCDLASARRISDEARRQGTTARGHLKIDIGMGRLGILLAEAPCVIRAIRALPALVCEGIYAHLPLADRLGDPGLTSRQIDSFSSIIDLLGREGIAFEHCHVANSDALTYFPQVSHPPFNLVRTGIHLHGIYDHEGSRKLGLRPVLTLKTRLAACRRMPAGSTLGYGATCRLEHDTMVGTISAGYADGLPLALSNRGHVLIGGRVCPVIGRVSMDYATVSLEQAPGAAPGDEAVCLGGTGPQAVTVESWARMKGTHAYEIICSFGKRVSRCYTDA